MNKLCYDDYVIDIFKSYYMNGLSASLSSSLSSKQQKRITDDKHGIISNVIFNNKKLKVIFVSCTINDFMNIVQEYETRHLMKTATVLIHYPSCSYIVFNDDKGNMYVLRQDKNTDIIVTRKNHYCYALPLYISLPSYDESSLNMHIDYNNVYDSIDNIVFDTRFIYNHYTKPINNGKCDNGILNYKYQTSLCDVDLMIDYSMNFYEYKTMLHGYRNIFTYLYFIYRNRLDHIQELYRYIGIILFNITLNQYHIKVKTLDSLRNVLSFH